MTQTLSREAIEQTKNRAHSCKVSLGYMPGHDQRMMILPDEVIALCTMALSASSEYERGQRDAIAAAVMALVSRKDTTITDKSDDWDKGYEVSLDQAIAALRALSPGEWVAVPAEREKCAKSGFHDHDGCSCSDHELRSRAMLSAKD